MDEGDAGLHGGQGTVAMVAERGPGDEDQSKGRANGGEGQRRLEDANGDESRRRDEQKIQKR